MIPKPWARAMSLLIVVSLLTSVYVITDFPTREVRAVNHGGVISVNETWSGTGNHFITSNVTITENAAVYVEAGADILFEVVASLGPLNIFVNGTFILDGTPMKPITVYPRVQSGKEFPGDWGTIYYNATSNDTASKVSYTEIGYGTTGLYLEDSNIIVENCEIHNMSQEGIVSYASSPIIRNSTLHYNNFGIWAEAGGEPLIQNNTIEWNMYDGIYGVSRVNPTIKDNIIQNNIDDGIHLLALFAEGKISNNTITFNRDMGMVINVRADVLVTDNNISRNGDAGIWIRAAGPTIHHNLITNNTRNGIRLFDCKVTEGCPQPTIANNTIAYNNKESGLYPGIFVENADPLIMNNYIAFNDAEGIYLKKDSAGNISSNAILNNQLGISLDQSSPWVVNNNPISGNIAGIYVKGGEPLIKDNVITNNRYGIYTYDGAKPGIYRNVIASASGKDLLVGDMDGKVSYFQNRGESVFKDLGRVRLDTGADVDVGSNANPAWGDIDYDGLDDLLVGNAWGNVQYFRNLGNGFFHDMGFLTNETPVTSIGNIIGSYCNPFITDWDQDGDQDIFCGTTLSGHIFYLTNNGDNTFTGRGRITEGPFTPLDPGSKSAPFFLDWNGDGDDDLIVGNFWGDVRYYENNEPPGGVGNISFTYSSYVQWNNASVATDIYHYGNNMMPWMVDWDGDTRQDLVTSNETGAYLWMRSIANLFGPPTQLLSSPGVEINARAVDWNSDGYQDLIVGGLGGYIKYYRNDGTDNFQMIQMKNGTKDLYLLPWASPFPVDFDGDGVLDLIIGDKNGDVWFFRGTGTGGSPVLEFMEILRGSGEPRDIKVGQVGSGMAAISSTDWDNDDRADLVIGETNGFVWLFTNDGDETFSSHGRAHNLTGRNIRTPGMSAAPAIADWDGDMLDDLIVGDSFGYLYFWKRNNVLGDKFNFTVSGNLMADGSPLRVSAYACPYVDDWNADGDMDILVGELSGRVLYYENVGDGTLTLKGNLSNILGGDLKVSNNACPQGIGYHGSLQGYKGGIGIYAKDSSPQIVNNVMIKGGDGNRTAGTGEMGGVGIYLLRSNAVISDNKNISGGTGGLGVATPGMDIYGGQGGHGIYLDNSTGYINDNVIIGGVGGAAEAATDPFLSIGGAGGSGVYAVNNSTTSIISNVIIAGDGSVGLSMTGGNGSGVKATNNSKPYIDNCLITGGIGVYADNSTPYIVNSTIDAYVTSFNVTNKGHAIALNTIFDRTLTYYGDDESVLETQWFLDVKVVDRSGFYVPDTTITIERDGLAFMGHLSSAFAPLATTAGPAPTVVDWDEDGFDDLLIGENDGDVQWYRNQGDNTYQTPPVTLLRGSITGMGMARPYVYDLDFDGEPDVVIGDSQGRLYWYKRNGTNLEFYSFFNLVDGMGQFLGYVNVSGVGKAAPAIGDWNGDGFWDLVVGDGTGIVNIFHRVSGTFDDFTDGGIARMTDGTPARSFMAVIPHVVDWNDDGERDLLLASMGQVSLFLSCENGTLLWGGPFYANRSGLNPILVGGFSSVTVVDYNGDGDLDLLVGATNMSLPDTGNIEYFESARNGDTRTLVTDDKGELNWIIVTEFIESDKNGNHFGDDPGDKVYYTPHSIKAKKNIDIGCASPQALMTESRQVIVTMCRDVTLPMIEKTYPVSGQQEVPINELVKIYFSKPMDNNSVIGATTVYSDNPMAPNTPFDFWWEDNYTVLTLCLNQLPLCLMEKDRHYTVKVRGLAQDLLGLHLDGNRNGKENGSPADDYVFSFHTQTLDKEPPTAVLNSWPPSSTLVAPMPVVFSGVNSTDNVGIIYWEILVDNGAPQPPYEGPDIQNATTPQIWFNFTGTFCTNLTVYDAANFTDSDTLCLDVLGADVNPPVVDAGPDQNISIGQNITFDGSASYDNVTVQANLNFTWDFWNGTNLSTLWGMNPLYNEFLTIGTYMVTLTVTDEALNSASDTMDVNVSFDSPPIANAGPNHAVCAGDFVTLDASATTDDNPINDLTFNWTFFDGTAPIFLQGMTISHQFNVGGSFLIELNVTDLSGNWDISTTTVDVTVCIKPILEEWGPVGSDKLTNVTVWAKFSKDMVEPNVTFAFSLRELVSGAKIVGFTSYDPITRNFTFENIFAPLNAGTTYQACINASIALDTEGFYFDGNGNNVSEMHPTDTYCWTFRTANLPSVMSTTPSPGKMNVSVKTEVAMSFNVPMNAASVEASFSMTDGTSVWDSTPFSVGWSTDLLILTLSNFTFEFSKTYTVTIDSSLAKSEIGMMLDGNLDGFPTGPPLDDYVWSFMTEPTPTVTGSPTGVDIPLDANIVLTFNKIMDWGSVKSALTIIEQGSPVLIDSFGKTSFDNDAKTFTIDPFSLFNNEAYDITLSGDFASGAKDLNGNTLDGNANSILEGSADDYSWVFQTVAIDDVPPQVVTNTPLDGATSVSIDSKIIITFSELINEFTFATGIAAKVNMSTYSLEPFADSVWYTANRTLILTPHGGLDYDTTYSIIISGDYIDGVKDLADNPLDGDKDGTPEGSSTDDHVFTFKTPDPTPPYIVNTTPYSDEEDVRQDTNVTITFDDNMNETTLTIDNVTVIEEVTGNPVSGNLTYDSQLKTLTFDPDDNLLPARTYIVTISNVLDTDGNLMSSPYVWSFTTALDIEPPTVTITYPLNGFTITQGDEVVITGTAVDDSGIQSILIQIGSGSQIDITSSYNPADGTWSYAWDTGGFSPGDVTINVTAYDMLLLFDSYEVSGEIETEPADDITGLILVVLAVILVVVATLLFFWMWRRRRETAEDELIAEEVRKEMDEEREAEGEESPEEEDGWGKPEEVESPEEETEPEEAVEPEEEAESEDVGDEVDNVEELEKTAPPKLKKPVRRIKK
ncbi:MAG: Ig-like domain-containing protein [Thermoplasmata archaeon]|nr:Ig-like domain-containing protein [Thermoplasmata archaeon]